MANDNTRIKQAKWGWEATAYAVSGHSQRHERSGAGKNRTPVTPNLESSPRV